MRSTGIISTFISISVLFLGFQAEAARWVIKNPKQLANLEDIRGISAPKYLELKNNYVIVDSQQRLSANQLVQMFNAESAFEDLKITIDTPVREDGDAKSGWHTELLEYDQLNKNATGEGIIVAVLDTGVDYKHPALEKKMWKNYAEIPDNEIDDDQNGLVDDYHGYNFNDSLSDPFDYGRHGTHCAGIIAADKHKTLSARGVAPDVKIMPLLIIGGDDMGFLADAGVAIKYAVDNGAKVLSNSWRIYQDWNQFLNPEGVELLKEAIEYANDHEVIFVGAAGNEKRNLDETNLTNPIIPLSFDLPNMVAVASTNKILESESLSSFSNYGAKSVQVAAPGSNITSTTPYAQWATMSGTSMATPIVAGTLARGLSKGFTMKQAMENLNQTSVKSAMWQQYVIHGRIDIKKYLE